MRESTPHVFGSGFCPLFLQLKGQRAEAELEAPAGARPAGEGLCSVARAVIPVWCWPCAYIFPRIYEILRTCLAPREASGTLVMQVTRCQKQNRNELKQEAAQVEMQQRTINIP